MGNRDAAGTGFQRDSIALYDAPLGVAYQGYCVVLYDATFVGAYTLIRNVFDSWMMRRDTPTNTLIFFYDKNPMGRMLPKIGGSDMEAGDAGACDEELIHSLLCSREGRKQRGSLSPPVTKRAQISIPRK
jgi:hypothetical protein